ncbi:MAG: hypothetical protein AAFY44_17125 [Pseudomonadota bacterium]
MGVIVFKGMRVGVLPGDLSIGFDESGELNSNLILSTAYNVLPVWLRVASDQLKEAKAASDAISSNWGEDEIEQKEMLVRELEPSLLVFVACGIALDAVYDLLRPYAAIDDDTRAAWKRKRTSRPTRMKEVFRRVYRLDKETTKNFGLALDNIIKLRDRAVHPTLALERTCDRPDIPVGVDWKFSAYRYSNGRVCFENTMNMVIYLYERRSMHSELNDQMESVVEALIELGIVTRRSADAASAGSDA